MSAEDNAKVETEIYITEQRFVMMLSFPTAICQLPWNKVTQGQHQNRNPTQEWARNQDKNLRKLLGSAMIPLLDIYRQDRVDPPLLFHRYWISEISDNPSHTLPQQLKYIPSSFSHLYKRLNTMKVLCFPHQYKFITMQFCPFFHKTTNFCWEETRRNIQIPDVHWCPIIVILHMKMRRVVFIKVHWNDNPKKSWYFWYTLCFSLCVAKNHQTWFLFSLEQGIKQLMVIKTTRSKRYVIYTKLK